MSIYTNEGDKINTMEVIKMRKYELIPTNGRKSFYGKAVVYVDDSGTETLYSYGTPVVKREPSGAILRLWGGWSATTGNHIKSFCGMNKSEFSALKVEA